MAISDREDKLWSWGWLLGGTSAMIAGFIQGYRHDDSGLMVGTIIVTLIILVTNVPVLRSRS